MKKLTLLILTGITLLSCGVSSSSVTSESSKSDESSAVTSDTTSDVINTSESNITSEETSTPPSTESLPPVSEEPSEPDIDSSEPNPDSSEEDAPLSDLTEIRALGLTYVPFVNAVGVYTSNVTATFTAQLLTAQDYITTQAGYGDRYFAFVANETGYITLKMSYRYYENLNKYHENQDVYTFTGHIGLYNDEVVVELTAKPTHLPGVSLTYDLNSFSAARGDLTNFITNVKSLKRNSKGIAFNPQPTTYTLKYVEKVENAIALFTDGVSYVKMHSHQKINNYFTLGKVYNLTVREGSFYYYAEFEYLSHTTSNKVITEDFSSAAQISASALYNYTYDDSKGKENATGNMNYMDISANRFYFEGYVNIYADQPKYSLVIDDTSKPDYGTYINARDGKALFINNDHSANKYLNELENFSPLYDYTFPESNGVKPKISFYFTPYRMNSQKYWQIQIFTDTVTVLDV